ncbi:hypothetical protein GALMADRAFT_224030 [Galerina marginata CBS 339.88]|uniref:Uncharacterized protein n=1 Tax=Galerina marginata (strain CBS 339.88) TaxID=685588 RepID=A0A067T6M3_GALM3|nr:hypothetical protein GALMADRAFT_224030 [Galerina marginata CBS 339.88]
MVGKIWSSYYSLVMQTSDGSEPVSAYLQLHPSHAHPHHRKGDESVDVEESVRVLPDVVDRTNHRTCGALSWRSDPDTTTIGPSGSAPSRSACVPLRRSDSTSLQHKRKNSAGGHSSSIRSTTPRRIHNLTSSPTINGNRTLQSHSVNRSLQVGSFPSLSGQNKLVNSSTREQVPEATNEKENWPTDDSQIVLVLRFLQTCTPSMGRFLHCFVEYGCLKVDHLRSISIWPRGERRELLKQILRIGSIEGEDFSRTDIAVLEKKFDDHFR